MIWVLGLTAGLAVIEARVEHAAARRAAVVVVDDRAPVRPGRGSGRDRSPRRQLAVDHAGWTDETDLSRSFEPAGAERSTT